MTKQPKLYVIGDEETGVVFLRLDPVRASIVPKAEIERYGNDHSKSYREAFAIVAAAARKMIALAGSDGALDEPQEVQNAVKSMIGSGATISDANFCFIADVSLDDLEAKRKSVPPLLVALQMINPDAAPTPMSTPAVPLVDSVSDAP